MDTRERLNQVIECGLPVKALVGNTLPTGKHYRNLDVFGILERDIPEVKVDFLGTVAFGTMGLPNSEINKSHAEALSKASGSKLHPKNFIENYINDKRQKIISGKSIEIHAFYDPKTDYTYYFPLPKRSLVGL
jgi:hypothetical protein